MQTPAAPNAAAVFVRLAPPCVQQLSYPSIHLAATLAEGNAIAKQRKRMQITLHFKRAKAQPVFCYGGPADGIETIHYCGVFSVCFGILLHRRYPSPDLNGFVQPFDHG
jgi:hypothetical protein